MATLASHFLKWNFWGKKLRKSSTFVFKTDFFGKNFCNK